MRWLIFFLLLMAPAFAQSTDPDKPTALTSTITGSNTGGLSDEKTYYYAFQVNKGTLTFTLDVTPQDKSDGGGIVAWTLLDSKFAKLKYENLAAQGTAERQVKDMPVTIKRRVVLKLTVSGNVEYKLQTSGSAVKL